MNKENQNSECVTANFANNGSSDVNSKSEYSGNQQLEVLTLTTAKKEKNDCYYPKGSVLMNPGLSLTRSEESLINRFHEELSSVPIKNTSSALEQIRNITERYLKEGIILNGGKYVITDLVCEEIKNIASHKSTPDALKNDEEIIYGIVDSLLSRGGRVKYNSLDSKLYQFPLHREQIDNNGKKAILK